MKKLIFLIAITGMLINSYAQVIMSNEVPAAVTKVFTIANPKVSTVEWVKVENNFKANYMVDEKDKSATYTAKGKIIETEMQITVASLPTEALKYVNENYKDNHVKTASKIISQGKTTYSAKLNGLSLTFASNGKFVKSVTE